MTERPILMSAPMVRAILAGRKRQTRRVVKPQPPAVEAVRAQAGIGFGVFTDHHARSPAHFRVSGPVWAVRNLMGMGERESPEWICPYGTPGDRLWVRETLTRGPMLNLLTGERMKDVTVALYKADGDAVLDKQPDGFDLGPWWRGKGDLSAIYMPRWASRITLAVESVRVERLHDISEEDAKAEGVAPMRAIDGVTHRPVEVPPLYRDGFAALWREINGAESWAANPWVWVLGFSRVEVTRG